MIRLAESRIIKLKVCDPSRTVLVHLPHGVHKFAVYTEVIRDSGFHTISGGYYLTLKDAVKDFAGRVLSDELRLFDQDAEDATVLPRG